jgi:uncharacterized protein YciI
MFIISLTYKKPLKEIDKLIEPHIAFLDKYYANNTFLLSGPKLPRTGGIIIARCESKSKLEEILTQDPFYHSQVASYEITQMRVTKSTGELNELIDS